MIIFRYIGYGLSTCAILLLGYEVGKYLETKSIHLMILEEVMRDYDAAGLARLNKTAHGSYFSGAFHDVLVSLLNLPLLSVVVLTAAFLLFIARHCDVS